MAPRFDESVSYPSLIEALQATFQRIEPSEEFESKASALAELTGAILRAVSELEIREAHLFPAPF